MDDEQQRSSLLLSRVRSKLAYAGRDFLDPSASDEIRQLVSFAAFAAVLDALREAGLSSDHLRPLDELGQALEARLHGARHPLLESYRAERDGVRPSGPPPATAQQRLAQGAAIALVEILVEAGCSQKDAAAEVANAMAKENALGRQKKPLSPKTVEEWLSYLTTADERGRTLRSLADKAWLGIVRAQLALGRNWPPPKDEAVLLIRQCAAVAARPITARQT